MGTAFFYIVIRRLYVIRFRRRCTFTDAVIIDGHRVVSSAKRRTTKDNLMQGIGEALDAVLDSCDTSNIEPSNLIYYSCDKYHREKKGAGCRSVCSNRGLVVM